MTDADAGLLRIAKVLSAGFATARPAANKTKLIIDSKRGPIAVEANALREMVKRGLVKRQGGRIGLSDEGTAYLKRSLASTDGFQAQHRDLAEHDVDIDGETAAVIVNKAESPLSVIAARKDRNGKSFLTSFEYQAGERLRRDYSRGMLMQNLGVNWQAAGMGSSCGDRRGGIAELTDAALAARLRVENAMRAIGPELAGVLIDMCCYLKGLETVERERGWPARSAKIILKTALGALSRHYEPERARVAAKRANVVHWGAADYRPNIG